MSKNIVYLRLETVWKVIIQDTKFHKMSPCVEFLGTLLCHWMERPALILTCSYGSILCIDYVCIEKSRLFWKLIDEQNNSKYFFFNFLANVRDEVHLQDYRELVMKSDELLYTPEDSWITLNNSTWAPEDSSISL